MSEKTIIHLQKALEVQALLPEGLVHQAVAQVRLQEVRVPLVEALLPEVPVLPQTEVQLPAVHQGLLQIEAQLPKALVLPAEVQALQTEVQAPQAKVQVLPAEDLQAQVRVHQVQRAQAVEIKKL